MNVAALPYTLLIMLIELAAGGVAVSTYFDARRMVTRGYVQTGALVNLPLALAGLTIVLTVPATSDVDGYALASGWLLPLRASLLALVASLAAHLVASFALGAGPRVFAGALASASGVASLVCLGGLVSAPTWSLAGSLASLVVGGAVLGGALMAMSWGHWYLTNSGLPKEPLEQMSLLVLGAVIVSGVLTMLGAAMPPRVEPVASSVTVALVANPAFWLRVGVGLVFPVVLATLAWKAAAVRGMMSATGLLYVALGCVLAGELMARGLLFTTGLLV
ncbi:MAG: hypothetical protein IT299_07320 [Dehalococcoidia bacterium]|nr:hypothetical protein [Dehalococcoidia bacterium]